MTKCSILATVGPASFSETQIKKLDESGVDIFRINLSHTSLEQLPVWIEKLQSWTKKPVCLDSEGAQLRTGIVGPVPLKVLQEQNILFTNLDDQVESSSGFTVVPIWPGPIEKFFQVGDLVCLDFNSVTVQVYKVQARRVFAKVLVGGKIGNNKGVSIDRDIELPAVSEKDRKAFEIGKKFNIRHVALSFANSRADVELVRKLWDVPVFLISKIESRRALKNLKEISEQSDALLIDRGDLSRDVPIERVGLAQRYIIEQVKSLKKPVYVATNFLESLAANDAPTRGEMNDITSTILMGAQGLVLAAETAVGANPVKAVRLLRRIINEVDKINFESADVVRQLVAPADNGLIEPHGGALNESLISESDLEKCMNLEKIVLDEPAQLDAYQIATGGYSPIASFMNLSEVNSVLEHNQTQNGVVWTLPIVLQKRSTENIKSNQRHLLVKESDGKPFGVLDVEKIESVDLEGMAKSWFGTKDKDHPGVRRFLESGNYLVSGKVSVCLNSLREVSAFTLTPRQIRSFLTGLGWRKVVGFHTRNVLHGGHEYIQNEAVMRVGADGLLISPLFGPKKAGDFTNQAILETYQAYLGSKNSEIFSALLAPFRAYPRYSGPREAAFTALVRKNFGCSHMIIGRDHSGVGSYYPPDGAAKFIQELGDIGIKPVLFDTAYYCEVCKSMRTDCGHANRKEISATQVREYLKDSVEKVPSEMIRPEVFKSLKRLIAEGHGVFIGQS